MCAPPVTEDSTSLTQSDLCQGRGSSRSSEEMSTSTLRLLLRPAHAPSQPGTHGRQPGAAFDHHEREPGASDEQQVEQRVLAQMMRHGMHGQLVWQ